MLAAIGLLIGVPLAVWLMVALLFQLFAPLWMKPFTRHGGRHGRDCPACFTIRDQIHELLDELGRVN